MNDIQNNFVIMYKICPVQAKFEPSKAMLEGWVSFVSVNPLSFTFKVKTTNCFEIIYKNHGMFLLVKGWNANNDKFGWNEVSKINDYWRINIY